MMAMDLSNLPYKVRVKGSQQPPQQQPSTVQETTNPVTRTAISLEYASLRHAGHCPLGIYVTPSSQSIMQWDAVLFVHQGYYEGATLKFCVTFPTDYPDRPPSVHFVTDVFHPLVSTDGLVNLGSRFRPWRPKEHHVFDVLHFIKAMFKKQALDDVKDGDCWNKEAHRYHESTQTFSNLARQSSQLSQSSASLYRTKPPHMINFNELDTGRS